MCDLQKAHKWISNGVQQQSSAEEDHDSAARQVSACQLVEIEDTITELQTQESDQVKDVKTMLNTTDMEAIIIMLYTRGHSCTSWEATGESSDSCH